MNSMFAEELKDCKRWAKFAKRLGRPVPTDEEIRFKAHQMSTSDGIAAFYDSLREIGRRSSNRSNQTGLQKLEKLFQRL
jgi:hypothetical protein